MSRLVPYLFVGLGGFVGANARYIVARWAADRWGPGFPYGTFIINITGCLILGLFATLADRLAWNDAWRFTIAIGFVGAYTTFSTYEYESFRLVADGQLARAAANIIGSVIVGFAGVYAGVVLARLLLRVHG
ncbi:MAG TPA: fluoride efflux transporter CrcB [Chthonomonadaceae bacterium]|nr:fluoride efflux transporter CrcB [Chthonomonadaceae bacterium]